MFRTVIAVILFCVLTACGQMDHYQGETSRDDIENMGMNDEVTIDTENPRTIKNVGDTWGLKQDRKLIKQATSRIPGVEVRRIIMEAGHVWVTVDIEGEDEMSEKEVTEWKSEIQQAVYGAVPRYNIHVNVK